MKRTFEHCSFDTITISIVAVFQEQILRLGILTHDSRSIEGEFGHELTLQVVQI